MIELLIEVVTMWMCIVQTESINVVVSFGLNLVLTGGYEDEGSGGAVFVEEGVLWARGCTFWHNRAATNGGTGRRSRGAVAPDCSSSHLRSQAAAWEQR